VAPSPWSWESAWEEAGLALVLAVAYIAAFRRRPTSRLRAAAFLTSCALVAAVTTTPLATLALHYHLWAHLVQNVALAEWAPALAVFGLAPGMAAVLASYRPVRALTHPLVALPVWLAAYGAWHVPAIYEAALEHRALLLAEHVTYFGAGCLLWWAVFQDRPRRLSSGAKAAYVFAAFVFASPLGLLLALLPSPLYDFYVDAPRLWGLDAATDQQIAGIVMALSEATVFFGVFARFFVRFLAEEEAGYSQPHA
jgi:putative membrane protein